MPVPVAAWSKAHLSWRPQTLGSWFRISLEVWIYVYVFLYCAVLCRWTHCKWPSPVERVLSKCLREFV